jgi:cation:H+ antiporter
VQVLVHLIGGFLLLVVGGELLVRGAVQVAERLGMSPLLIGLTLVGFGTSTPELVTSVQAALAGSPGIAVGNIVGSNLANILLILGLSALLLPITVTTAALRRDGALVVATAAMLTVLGLVWTLDRLAGALFLAGLAAYLGYAWRQERAAAGGHTAAFERAEALREVHPELGAEPVIRPGLLLPAALALGGLALVVLGGGFLVDGAIALARDLGVSETVIGLTIVAVGTSLPELVTSVVAALRRHADVSLGNVLGSCIYNVLGIGGVTGLISPTVVPPEIARFDSPVMLAASVMLLVFAWTGLRIGRREGACLLAGYVAYVWTVWPH